MSEWEKNSSLQTKNSLQTRVKNINYYTAKWFNQNLHPDQNRSTAISFGAANTNINGLLNFNVFLVIHHVFLIWM